MKICKRREKIGLRRKHICTKNMSSGQRKHKEQKDQVRIRDGDEREVSWRSPLYHCTCTCVWL